MGFCHETFECSVFQVVHPLFVANQLLLCLCTQFPSNDWSDDQFDNFFPSVFLLTKASVCQWHSFSVRFGGFRLWKDLPRSIWLANAEALTMDILQVAIVFFHPVIENSKTDTYLYDNVGDYCCDLPQQFKEV